MTAAKPSNPDCVADDVRIIRNAFGADDIGPLFRTAAQRGWMAAMMHDFRANGCAWASLAAVGFTALGGPTASRYTCPSQGG